MLVPPVLWPFLASRSHQTSPCAERPSQHSGNLPGLHVVRGEQPGTLPPPDPPAFSLALGWSLQQLMTSGCQPSAAPSVMHSSTDTESGHWPSTSILHPAPPPSMSQLLAHSPEPAWAPSTLLCPTASTQHTGSVPWLAPAALGTAVLLLPPPTAFTGSCVSPGALGPAEHPSPVPWQGCSWWHQSSQHTPAQGLSPAAPVTSFAPKTWLCARALSSYRGQICFSRRPSSGLSHSHSHQTRALGLQTGSPLIADPLLGIWLWPGCGSQPASLQLGPR